MNFDHGKAEISAINGAVIAVTLYSNGPEDGMTAEDYLAKVRVALERKFKTRPVRTSGEGPGQEVAYSVGSLEVTLGPDPHGGASRRGRRSSAQASGCRSAEKSFLASLSVIAHRDAKSFLEKMLGMDFVREAAGVRYLPDGCL